MSPVSAVMTAADFMSPDQLIAHARRLEALGYDELWITDIFGREIYVTAGLSRAELDAVVHAVRALVSEVELVAERVNALQLRVLPA